MDKRVIRWVLMLLLPLAVPAGILAADEAATASFEGVLLDAAGKPAPGYPLAIKDPAGMQIRMQASGDGGSFGLSGMPPGNYELQVLPQDGGKTPLVSKKMTLVAGQKAKVEIRLAPVAPAAKAAPKPS